MNEKLKNRFVAITGASGGIGEKMAVLVAKSGGHPILIARRSDRLAAVAENITKQYDVNCMYHQLDVSDLHAVQQTFERILADVPQIDVLVNNAGFGIFNTVADASLEEMKSMFEVNVFGLIACTKMVLPSMQKKNEGHIINIASQAGKLATPKSSLYSASKHAVLGFTNSLRMELLETNVHVTSVNPGPIKTNFFEIADTSGNYVKNVERFMLNPDKVSEKIVNAMLTSRREINLPGWMNAGSSFYQLMPRLFEKVAGKALSRK
ncbi:SDR family NAD(P)-dependent oxidoreductase [Metabacillus idriensis]|uniref:SDR family NAD(P)-dependent oxidoreductase n=1 Tax=Metabacillus idriensis TaxID=324768 RepID=UPI00163AE62D|nr:SDR family oxidoreductase [Metabacillus idriensis]QNG61326.1 SDR family oxidoreductase [Bacillus sp. PAMC26568]